MDITTTKLYENVNGAGFEPITLNDETGSLLLTTLGSRVLGIFLDGASENLLWTPTEMNESADTAKQFSASGQWNLGGDRVWMSPEIQLHFQTPDAPTAEKYAVPEDLDPGKWAVTTQTDSAVAFATSGSATNLITKKPFSFESYRAIQLCKPPIAVDGLSYVGYELSSQLSITKPDVPEACYGMWQLMQLTPGGTILIPTTGMPELVDYFQTNITSHVKHVGDHVMFPVNGQTVHKLGIQAAHGRDLIAYYRLIEDDKATLVIRKVATFPGAIYADFPAHARDRRDLPLHFYNGGGFGEMEYHSVAANADNQFQTRDISRTWCFAGPADKVRQVGETLLGITIG